jgi:tetratricopeptide (TPR) repeat protein
MTILCRTALAKCCLAFIFIIIIGLPNPSFGEVQINPSKLLNDGIEAIKRSDYKKAFLSFKKACNLGNNQACQVFRNNASIDENTFYRYLGFDKARNNECDEAIKLYTLAIKLEPKDFKGYADRSRTYSWLKLHDKAISDANSIINIDPKLGYGARAYAYYRKGDLNNAVKDLKKDGTVVNANNLGIIFKELDDINGCSNK